MYIGMLIKKKGFAEELRKSIEELARTVSGGNDNDNTNTNDT